MVVFNLNRILSSRQIGVVATLVAVPPDKLEAKTTFIQMERHHVYSVHPGTVRVAVTDCRTSFAVAKSDVCTWLYISGYRRGPCQDAIVFWWRLRSVSYMKDGFNSWC